MRSECAEPHGKEGAQKKPQPLEQEAKVVSGFNGRGVLQDYVRAHMWLNLAAVGDVVDEEEAVKLRDMVAGLMTPDQIAEAQKMAREWLAAHPKK